MAAGVAARDGVEALRMLEETSAAVDLIVTDVMMPHLTGPELARRAAREVLDGGRAQAA